MKWRPVSALCMAALVLPVPPALADSRDAVKARIARCDAVAQTRPYLDCVYAAVQPLRSELGLPPAPQAARYSSLFDAPAPPRPAPPPIPDLPATTLASRAAAPPPQETGGFFSSFLGRKSALVAPEQFGLPNARPGMGTNVDHLVVPVTDFTLYTNSFSVTLANGQVWEQVAGDDARAHWSKAKPLIATITYGANDTYNLSVGERILYKVKRVK